MKLLKATEWLPGVSNNIEFSGSTVATTLVSVTEEMKKKRGRLRKYGPDGRVAVALSPMPISASIQLAGDFRLEKQWKSVDSFNKKNKFEVETPGQKIRPPHFRDISMLDPFALFHVRQENLHFGIMGFDPR